MTPRSKLAVIALLPAVAVSLSLLHPFGNPRAVPSQPREALLRDAHMPEDARQVLVTKCADCHSDTTHWPVYTHLAPGSWLMERDVTEGREHLNLSHWLELSQDRRGALSVEISQQAKRGTMPLPQYRLLHWNAKLTPADVTALSLLAGSDTSSEEALTGDPVRGQALFERRCTGCHSLKDDHEGPRLRGVFGTHASFKSNFKYSAALKSSSVNWTELNLERWLQDPDSLVPGNAMTSVSPR